MATKTKTAPVAVARMSANALARIARNAWRDPKTGAGPDVDGIDLRNYVRDHAEDDGNDALLPDFGPKTQYQGNYVHNYVVPGQTDVALRGMRLKYLRNGVTPDMLPFAGTALEPFVILRADERPKRKTAPKSTKASTPARKRATGGSVPAQTMAPAPTSAPDVEA